MLGSRQFKFIFLSAALINSCSISLSYARSVLDSAPGNSFLVMEYTRSENSHKSSIPATAFPAGSWTLGYRLRFAEKFVAFAEIPLAVENRDCEGRRYCYFNSFSSGHSGEAPGNILLGVEQGLVDYPVYLQVSIRVPSASNKNEDEFWYAQLSDYGRVEAYMPDYLTTMISFGSRIKNSTGFAFDSYIRINYLTHVGAGSKYLKDGSIVDLGAWVGQTGSWSRLRGGVMMRIPDKVTFISDKEIVLVKVEGDFLKGKYRPGVQFTTIPSDIYFAYTGIRYSFGFSLTILLSQLN